MNLSIEIPSDVAEALTAKAKEQGLTLEAWFEKLAGERGAPPPSATTPRRHIAEVIRERMSKVPPEIMAAMPKDGASQHDHYIYGFPRKEE